MECASLGIEPDTPLQHGHLIPFKGKVQLIIGFRGYVAMAYQSPEVQSMSTRRVYDNERRNIVDGTDPSIEHTPKSPEDRGVMLGSYACVKLANGAILFDFMWTQELYDIRDRSVSYKAYLSKGTSTPWITDEGEMSRKTVLKRLMKMVPVARLQRASFVDGQSEAGLMDLSNTYDIKPEDINIFDTEKDNDKADSVDDEFAKRAAATGASAKKNDKEPVPTNSETASTKAPPRRATQTRKKKEPASPPAEKKETQEPTATTEKKPQPEAPQEYMNADLALDSIKSAEDVTTLLGMVDFHKKVDPGCSVEVKSNFDRRLVTLRKEEANKTIAEDAFKQASGESDNAGEPEGSGGGTNEQDPPPASTPTPDPRSRKIRGFILSQDEVTKARITKDFGGADSKGFTVGKLDAKEITRLDSLLREKYGYTG